MCLTNEQLATQVAAYRDDLARELDAHAVTINEVMKLRNALSNLINAADPNGLSMYTTFLSERLAEARAVLTKEDA